MVSKIETKDTNDIKFDIGLKLAKVNDNCTINFYDNGYMVEISGRNYADDWATAKMIVGSLEELHDVLARISEMPKD
jgi:hypothetical protein